MSNNKRKFDSYESSSSSSATTTSNEGWSQLSSLFGLDDNNNNSSSSNYDNSSNKNQKVEVLLIDNTAASTLSNKTDQNIAFSIINAMMTLINNLNIAYTKSKEAKTIGFNHSIEINDNKGQYYIWFESIDIHEDNHLSLKTLQPIINMSKPHLHDIEFILDDNLGKHCDLYTIKFIMILSSSSSDYNNTPKKFVKTNDNDDNNTNNSINKLPVSVDTKSKMESLYNKLMKDKRLTEFPDSFKQDINTIDSISFDIHNMNELIPKLTFEFSILEKTIDNLNMYYLLEFDGMLDVHYNKIQSIICNTDKYKNAIDDVYFHAFGFSVRKLVIVLIPQCKLDDTKTSTTTIKFTKLN